MFYILLSEIHVLRGFPATAALEIVLLLRILFQADAHIRSTESVLRTTTRFCAICANRFFISITLFHPVHLYRLCQRPRLQFR